MKSRITIEFDYDSKEVVLQIKSQDSEDVRDGMVKSFLQAFGHASMWANVTYIGQDATTKIVRISPIRPENLSSHIPTIEHIVKAMEKEKK